MSWRSMVNRVVKIGVRDGLKYLRESQKRSGTSGPTDPSRGRGRDSSPGPAREGFSGRPRPAGQSAGTGYPGDFHGRLTPVYSPDLDGAPDPGEVVWGWVPYEEDHNRGKDRPALLIAREDGWLLALMLTSQDHIPGGVGEVRQDRWARWMNVGTGAWDSRGRASEVRLDRVIRLDPAAVRREGAIMDREIFELIAAHVDPR